MTTKVSTLYQCERASGFYCVMCLCESFVKKLYFRTTVIIKALSYMLREIAHIFCYVDINDTTLHLSHSYITGNTSKSFFARNCRSFLLRLFTKPYLKKTSVQAYYINAYKKKTLNFDELEVHSMSNNVNPLKLVWQILQNRNLRNKRYLPFDLLNTLPQRNGTGHQLTPSSLSIPC